MTYWTVFWLNAGIIMNSIGVMLVAYRLVKEENEIHLRIGNLERLNYESISELLMRVAELEARLPDNWRSE
jgi:hypothetical protein